MVLFLIEMDILLTYIDISILTICTLLYNLCLPEVITCHVTRFQFYLQYEYNKINHKITWAKIIYNAFVVILCNKFTVLKIVGKNKYHSENNLVALNKFCT